MSVPLDLSTILKATYKPQHEASHDIEKLGYKYDPESSTMERKVFTDKEGNPHFAFRGSVRANDWLGNAIIGLTGKPDPKMKQEFSETENILKNKYAGKTPTFYGHSRSGMTSEYLGDKFGGKTYTFNKATSPADIFKKVREDQTDIRTTKDIVSLPSIFQTGGTKGQIQSEKKQGIIESHAVKNLDNVEIQEQKKPNFRFLDMANLAKNKLTNIADQVKLQPKKILSSFK